MIHRQIQGLAFKVHSPSLLELDRNHGEQISVVAIHFADDRRWWVSILMKTGRSHSRGPFLSRDLAIALIAARVQAIETWA